MYRNLFKPFAEWMTAAAAAIILSPLIAVLVFAVRLGVGRPVLFRQTRIGLGNKPFTFIKFRTMTEQRDGNGVPMPDGDRMTPLGRFLRAGSLDELPQLWNVLKGEMNLIGPRPLLPQYLPLYSEQQRRRHEVKPGITGWAQVNGRNSVSWEEKFRLDVWYVDHECLALDLRILVLTVLKLIRREGINQPGSATMEEFRGNSTDISGQTGVLRSQARQ